MADKPHPTTVTDPFTASEPPNGTKLILNMGDGEWRVIYRDDSSTGPEYEDERWLASGDDEPMDLYQHIKYADAVYALGEPLAVFA